MTWRLLWECMLIGSLAMFAVMAVFVTIGGAKDIRRMLRRLKSMKDDERSTP